MNGLESYLILRQTDAELQQKIDPGLTGNLMISRMVGANLVMVSKSEYARFGQKVLLNNLIEQLEQEGKKPYGIAVGGSVPLGAWGYIKFVQELQEQMQAMKMNFSDIVVACGSGGTAAGLAIGVFLAGLKIRVHAILVCDDKNYFRQHIQDTIDALGVQASADEIVVLHDEYRGKAYAVSTEQELETIRQAAAASSILTDPVYTGKALCGLHGLMRTPELLLGKDVLFLHTGGMFGIFDKEEQLLPLLGGKISRLQLKSSL
uniref:Tryptophan synthase beta chain-like PALP domain-containing protein n=1 Tax=Guillardia theta TaxID=55529 RepID=A0A7S4HAA5_GUITH|mmetsp:Transcript_11908/g.41044  ORF Transcript_11908/g.41044 Transcript_11908/m.41044 type:complete len:262 (+) Transcript_11908:327-1112(+)